MTKASSTGAYTTTFEYAYDAVGNRTTQTRTLDSTEVITYAYDEANRLIDVGGATYTWDDNGTLLNAGEKTYTYDQANQLKSIVKTTGDEPEFRCTDDTSFIYSGTGVRLRRDMRHSCYLAIPKLSTQQYVQDLAAPLPVVIQMTEDNSTITQYAYALGTHPIVQYTDGVAEYLLPDALGSVRQIVDGSSNVILAESYEPYGSVLTSNGTASSIFGYAGEEVDSYIKLLILRPRHLPPMSSIGTYSPPLIVVGRTIAVSPCCHCTSRNGRGGVKCVCSSAHTRTSLPSDADCVPTTSPTLDGLRPP